MYIGLGISLQSNKCCCCKAIPPVPPDNTVTAASTNPTLCINTELIAITHETTGATGIGLPTGLPTGVTASWENNIITISGTPTVSEVFNYSIPLTGGSGTVFATGTITVVADNTVTEPSSRPTLCINTELEPITYNTLGATGIGLPINLPAGVTASWVDSIITLDGTPLVTGSFSYSIPLTGGCNLVFATGSIIINPNNTVTTASSTPTVCIDTALIPITHITTGATGIGTVTGLPAEVTASWNNNIITISGTPLVTGSFNYNIPLTGGCSLISATGSITVNPSNTVTTASGELELENGVQPFSPITHDTTGATGIGTPTGLPTGLEAFWVENKIFIQGVPQETGSFNYSIPLTGGCSLVSATGTIIVSEEQEEGLTARSVIFNSNTNGIYKYDITNNSTVQLTVPGSTELTSSPDIAHTSNKLWTVRGTSISEWNIQMNPFVATFNRTITLPTNVGAGLAAINDTTLLTTTSIEGRTWVVPVNITQPNATWIHLFPLPVGRVVAGDLLLTTTGKLLITTAVGQDRYLSQYDYQARQLEVDILISPTIQRPYGMFIDNGEIYVIDEGPVGNVYRVNKTAPYALTQVGSTGVIVYGASQIPEYLTTNLTPST